MCRVCVGFWSVGAGGAARCGAKLLHQSAPRADGTETHTSASNQKVPKLRGDPLLDVAGDNWIATFFQGAEMSRPLASVSAVGRRDQE